MPSVFTKTNLSSLSGESTGNETRVGKIDAT